MNANLNAKISEETLTAYVMGELAETERKAVEKAMASDPALKAEAESLRGFCGTLWSELKSEAMPDLGAERQAQIKRQVGGAAPRRFAPWLTLALPGLAVAAAAALFIYPKISERPNLRRPQKSAAAGSDASEVRFVQAEEERAAPATKAKTEASPIALAEKKAGPQQKFDYKTAANKPMPSSAPSLMQMESAGAPAAVGGSIRGKSQAYGLASNHGVRKGGIVGDSFMPRRQPPPPSDGFGEEEGNTEAYDLIVDNPFRSASQEPLSTFSADVDTASYSNIRRFISSGQLPPKDAVRIEEMVNYFRYDYAEATDRPFSVNVEVGAAPWKPEHRLVRIGLRAKDITFGQTPPSNLVFLIDVSGSMDQPNKLPLVRQSLKLMIDKLGEQDKVAVVVYAGNSGVVLPSTSAVQKQKILDAVENMQAGGSTNGSAGIKLAYETAQAAFIKGGINRVILATDGDFNVGTTSQGELVRLIESEAKQGVFLSVLGFGMGNLKDSTMEKLADKGNGNYAYIDTINEARKALVEEIGGTLVTVAKDVKLQVEFNPDEVQAYRLIGYENRILAHEDFNNDAKDAGDIGAGHVVTAFYEVVPKGVAFDVPGVDKLKYSQPKPKTSAASSGELLSLKLRYKQPDASKSSLIEFAVKDSGKKLSDASPDFKFAAGVAEFGMLLRASEFKGNASYTQVLELTGDNLGEDKGGYRKELVELIRKANGMPKR